MMLRVLRSIIVRNFETNENKLTFQNKVVLRLVFLVCLDEEVQKCFSINKISETANAATYKIMLHHVCSVHGCNKIDVLFHLVLLKTYILFRLLVG